MNTLVQTLVQEADKINYSVTANGAKTLLSSNSCFVDLFSVIGSARNDHTGALDLFKRCYYLDSKLAIRIALWARDVRGGAGERSIVRSILQWMAENTSKTQMIALIQSGIIDTIGRWDDYISIITSNASDEVRRAASSRWLNAIKSGNQLAAKWCPRKGKEAATIRKYFMLSPKQYRKLLVITTNVVETKMCEKKWDEIVFEHVPSVAMARYTRAFARNSKKFDEYKTKLATGEAKINTAALYPYDVIRTVRHGDAQVADAQWKKLENFVDSPVSMLPIIDVSGSMCVPVSGSVSAMDIATSLGIYVAEKNSGVFKNLYMTFSESPTLVYMNDGDSIQEKLHQVENSDWGGNTDLQKAFDLLLDLCIKNGVAQGDIPKFIFIVSDMEFDVATRHVSYDVTKHTYHEQNTNFQVIEEKFQSAGYVRPNIVFWNVNARTKNVQCKFDEYGTALISGFSPRILKSVLSTDLDTITPQQIMMDAIMVSRYGIDGVTL